MITMTTTTTSTITIIITTTTIIIIILNTSIHISFGPIWYFKSNKTVIRVIYNGSCNKNTAEAFL
jgi:hypothetical protein